MPTVFAGASLGSGLTAVGLGNLFSSSRPWPSGVSIIADVNSDVFEPDNTVRPPSLDERVALQLRTEFDEERDRSPEVVDNDSDARRGEE